MVIIHGEQGTGKSTLALNLIKNKENSLYLVLENDFSIINKIKKSNTDFTLIKYCTLIDLKYRILENGGLINNSLEYVVIDSINFIKDNISYKQKIKYLEELETDFKIKIILVFNTLNRMDKMVKFIHSLENHKLIDINSVQVPRLQPLQ
jgi:ABC-type dipeptide/oligopeptide/nickel transport system ATPase subunit